MAHITNETRIDTLKRQKAGAIRDLTTIINKANRALHWMNRSTICERTNGTIDGRGIAPAMDSLEGIDKLAQDALKHLYAFEIVRIMDITLPPKFVAGEDCPKLIEDLGGDILIVFHQGLYYLQRGSNDEIVGGGYQKVSAAIRMGNHLIDGGDCSVCGGEFCEEAHTA